MLHFDWLWGFGLVSALLSVLAFLPYIYDMVRGVTLAHRATWLIWSVLSTLSLFSSVQSGAAESVMFMTVQAGATSLICALSIWFGVGSLLRPKDCLVLLAAAFGLWLWWITDNAAYTLTIAIAVSALAGSLTLTKAFRDPNSESWGCWAMASVASAFAIVSVGHWDPVLLAYPVYLLVIYLGILCAVYLGRRRLRNAVHMLATELGGDAAKTVVAHQTNGPNPAPSRIAA